jgi:Icc protein
MLRSVKLVQVSDCHVSADGQALYRGINPRHNFEKLLDRIRSWQPDALILTGDLSEDASKASYAYLAGTLSTLDVPVWTLPGNHDHPQSQQKYFPETAVAEPLVQQAGEWRLVLLNSSVEGAIHGAFSESVLTSLEQELAPGDVPAIVALHHQPLPVGGPWIDRYALRDADALWRVLDRAPCVKAVIWGHVHQGFDSVRGHIRLLGAPSSAANSLPGCERFTHDETGPACRLLELCENGILKTGLLSA